MSATAPVATPAWMNDAACRHLDTNVFFPDTDIGEHTAQRICATCTVRNSCATYALEHDELRGVWGGLTERDRRRIRRAAWDAAATQDADPLPRRPGPRPVLTDTQLAAVFAAMDTTRPAAEQLREQLAVSTPTIYKYLDRARSLGVVEHRGRNLYPRPR